MAHEKVKNSARLYLYMGMSLTALGRTDEGREALQKAVDLDRKVGRGLPYIYLVQYEINRQGEDSEEVTALEKEFRDFANTENFFRMGMVYKNINKNKARAMFDLAIEDYAYVPKTLRKIHRKWALFSRINRALLG